MKNFFIVAFMLISANFVKAQNNLVFNEAKLVTLSVITEVTVPIGKVWKVEHADGVTNSETIFLLNNIEYTFEKVNTSSTGALWLPAGTSIKKGNTVTGKYATDRISLIEFNVVPL